MAKKVKKAEEPEDGAAPEEIPSPGRSRKPLIFGGIELVVLAALGGGGYYFFAPGKHETAEAPKATKPSTSAR